MPLTYDRPGATAATLNAGYATLRASLAPKLPLRLRDRLLDGTVIFDTSALLDLDEDDPEADCVESLDDLPLALVSKGRRAWGRGRWTLARDGAAWRVEVRETRRTLPLAETFRGLPILVSATGSIPSDPLHAEVRFEDLGSGSYGVLAAGFLVASPEGAAPGVVGAWETFDGSGYAEWDVGVRSLVALVEGFDGTGYEAWAPGGLFRVASAEQAWTGWPNGVEPVLPAPGGPVVTVVTGDVATVDLSGQIDGSTTSFTLPEFVAGSVRLYLNGQRLTQGTDFSETSSTTVLLAQTMPVPDLPDALLADYIPCTC
jgi:hypothetical protein